MTSLPCPPPAPDLPDGRSRLAAVAATISHPDLAPQAVGVAFHGDQVELHVKDLGDAHPVDQLLGFRAPDAWDAFGVTVAGRTVPYPPGGAGAGPVPDHRPLLLTFLAGRDGAAAALLVPEGHEPLLIDEPGGSEVQGAIADLCWRVLGRPTAPPQITVAEFWAAWWLDRIVALAATDPSWSPSWDTLIVLHPATGAWTPGDDGWTRLRTDPASAHLLPPGTPTDLLDWMDDGFLSRWAVSQLPDPRELLDAIAELLPSQLVDRVEQVACETGLPARAGRAAGEPTASGSG